MTGRAAYALRHVNAVIEIRILWKVVHPFPFDRLIVAKARTYGLEKFGVRPDLAVTIHASLRRRHAGRGRCFDRRVAVTAIDAVVAYVMLMTELNGLLLFEVSSGEV